MVMLPQDQRDHLIYEFYRNRRLAHEVLFKHRHPIKTPHFHHKIQDAFHSPHPQVVVEGFRDAAKSTVAEEAFVLQALFREFKNGVVIGASYPRAKERLAAISNEFIVNDGINQLFGKMEGPTWGAGKIVLANGVCIQALGAGMSMRGMRYLDARPDFGLIDDLEDEESIRTPEARQQMMSWLYRTFLPALAKGEAGQIAYRVRFMGNRLDEDAVIVRVSKDPSWQHLRFPIMEQTDDGVERFDLPAGRWRPLWGEKFSIEDIATKRQEYQRLGLLHDWECEYMCQADNPEAHIFRAGDAKTVPQVRTWQNVYASYDPARTVGVQSATTGIAVFSWLGQRLVVWRGAAEMWLPDQICDDIFKVDAEFSPTAIGVEATGLEEFIMQPLRHKALERRVFLPLRRLDPPRGKDSFIRSLQPFFKSGAVEFVDVSDEARGQLLSFPTGRKDFPNALAYALLMRPGLPVYEISMEHYQEQTLRYPGSPWWLVVNATNQYTTAVLLQLHSGQVRVHADWLREGPPGETLSDVVREARLEAGERLKLICPPARPGSHDTVGLRVAIRAVQQDPRSGGDILRGRDALRQLLQQRRRDQPLLVVSRGARWTLNGLAGGYAWEVDKRGQLSNEPVANEYRVLMEGLESFVAAMHAVDDNAQEARTAVDAQGRTYKTILATATAPAPSKDEWHHDVTTSLHSIRRQ